MTDAVAPSDQPDLYPASVRSGLLSMRLLVDAAPAEVWRHLTEPGLLAGWSPLVPDRTLDAVGPAEGRERPADPALDASVLEVVPQFRLVHRWGAEELIWQLAPSGEQTQLQLVQRLSDADAWPDMAAGWHICLSVLAARLRGEDAERLVGDDALAAGWQQLRDRYAATVVVNDADN